MPHNLIRFARALPFALALALALTLPAARAADCPPDPQPPDVTQAESAPDRGLLWRIERHGRVSWLYGSLHLGKPDWIFPGPALREAWEQTELLAVELDLGDPQTMATLGKLGRVKQAPPAPLRERLEAQTRAACLPEQALATLHPLLQLSSLTALTARWDGFDIGYGQEFALLSLARHQGRKIVALETAAEQLGALIPTDAKEAATLVDQGLRQLEGGHVRAPLVKLARAWERGDLARLENYEQWCECVTTELEQRWLRRLNDGRNPQLAKRIAALHAEGKPVLAVVGALHMSGPEALPRLLGKLGFKVERVGTAAAGSPQ